MRTKYLPTAALARLIKAQSGVLSRQQALDLGVPAKAVRRFLNEGHWTSVAHGIYAAGAEPDWLGRAWAGVLIGGPDAVVGGTGAGYLQGVVTEPPALIPIFTGDQHVRMTGGPWEFRRIRRDGVGEPPRTRFAETLLDLCAVADDDRIMQLLANHAAGSNVRRKHVLEALHERPRQPQRALITEVLADIDEGVRSPLERRYYRDVERAHGLPRAARQARTGSGHQVDCRYDPWGLVVELDGRRFHSGSRQFVDMSRDNEQVLEGTPTLRFSWPHVFDACATAALVARGLQGLGWPGEARCCRRCAATKRAVEGGTADVTEVRSIGAD